MTPFSQVTITDPNELFGRKELIEKLLSLANRHDNVAIIGTRRFGKTCLLKCIETVLRRDDKSTSYPIYFDFKSVGSIIKGTEYVYKYMVCILVSKLFCDKHFTNTETIKKITITPSEEWEDIYEQIQDVSFVQIQGLFEAIIKFFAELLGKTILFLIDEYEYLFKYSFDSPEGFMKMRTISTQSLENGLRPFSFWIAGAVSWDYLCTVTGSGELNGIGGNTISLSPLAEVYFREMWNSEISTIENSELKNLLDSNIEFTFHNSGGVPFFGKCIGSYIIVNNIVPDYSILKANFQEIDNALHLEEKKILNILAQQSQNIKGTTLSVHINALLEKGLIRHGNNKSYEISIGFYRDYLLASLNDADRLKPKISESQAFTDKITGLIETINKTNFNKKKIYIFDPVNDSASLEKDLRTLCSTKEQFADFASSLYKVYFERTKDNDKNKAKLPYNFKNSEFSRIVDTLRHSLGGGHEMDKLSQYEGQMSKVEMLEILTDSKNEPYNTEDFEKLQIEILKRFEKELTILLNEVRKD
ncbi:hypothetical protein EZS27_000698 [termite gut metagenome]|uniref:AAA-ATPase-like domain-containing protein n=1 Tax=termite gut metagenome TaxID=433724 RepID=A0A5J4T2M3_9ZZZZ